MNKFDPDQIAEGKRRIASRYYPLIGPYDSGDPAVIEYHLLLMKVAGIDGVIVDWYGRSDLYDYPIVHRNCQAVFDAAQRVGLRFAVCYEDQTINQLVAQKRIAPGDRVKHAREEIAWLRGNWFRSPAYLKWEGRPVMLSFGWGGLTEGEWNEAMQASGASVAYLSEHRKRNAAVGAFDWPDPQAGLSSLERFNDAAKAYPLSMPVAFPRFDDVYKEAGVQPGYPRIPDANGATFAQSVGRACRSGAPFVQIATWNDWGEGTQIEPSREFGYRDVEAVQRLRRAEDGSFRASREDLRLPYELWRLRQRQRKAPQLKPTLDAAARLLAAGHVRQARASLAGVVGGNRIGGPR